MSKILDSTRTASYLVLRTAVYSTRRWTLTTGLEAADVVRTELVELRDDALRQDVLEHVTGALTPHEP